MELTNRRKRIELLFEAGVQYGHRTKCWCPKMKPFIWGEKDGIYLINVALTDIQLSKAEEKLESIAASGLPILWVGTKKVARNIVTKHAIACDSPYFSNRWIGGSLTNYHEVKKAVKNMLFNEEILQKSDRSFHTKKELNVLGKKIDRAKKTVSGIEKLTWPIGALVIVDAQKDRVAINEAYRMGIPVISLVDTNCDPEGISIVIPANDDLEKSIDILLKYLSDSIVRGKEKYLKENPKAAVEKEDQEKTDKNKKTRFDNNKNRGYSNRPDFNNKGRDDKRAFTDSGNVSNNDKTKDASKNKEQLEDKAEEKKELKNETRPNDKNFKPRGFVKNNYSSNREKSDTNREKSGSYVKRNNYFGKKKDSVETNANTGPLKKESKE
jgi:small subunit ribosomal protein S2